MNVLEKIKECRKKKFLSQEDMSDRLGMSQNNYGKIERGDTELTVSRLIQIAKAIQVPVFELVGEDVNEIIDLIKKNYERELDYYRMIEKRNEVVVKHLMKDLEHYRNLLFEKAIIDSEELSRNGTFLVGSSRIAEGSDGEQFEEILKRKSE